jgi:hypothetical protein
MVRIALHSLGERDRKGEVKGNIFTTGASHQAYGVVTEEGGKPYA